MGESQNLNPENLAKALGRKASSSGNGAKSGSGLLDSLLGEGEWMDVSDIISKSHDKDGKPNFKRMFDEAKKLAKKVVSRKISSGNARPKGGLHTNGKDNALEEISKSSDDDHNSHDDDSESDEEDYDEGDFEALKTRAISAENTSGDFEEAEDLDSLEESTDVDEGAEIDADDDDPGSSMFESLGDGAFQIQIHGGGLSGFGGADGLLTEIRNAFQRTPKGDSPPIQSQENEPPSPELAENLLRQIKEDASKKTKSPETGGDPMESVGKSLVSILKQLQAKSKRSVGGREFDASASDEEDTSSADDEETLEEYGIEESDTEEEDGFQHITIA